MRLVLEGLGKRYRGDHWGLRGVDCELGPGVVGLLGPNGAGKSTLLRIVATITGATEGRVLWDGADVARDPDAVRRWRSALRALIPASTAARSPR
jgi:ABC-type multidrug transport system ATPase subunit